VVVLVSATTRRKMSRFFATALLSVCLVAPGATVYAQDHDRDHQTHQWTADEDPHWHQYLKEHHKKDHDWAHANKREQRDYWKWRDAHPDAH
jgi:hypothetical protein